MRALIYIAILLIATGCSHSAGRYAHELDEAQTMLAQNPVKALEELNGFDVTEFNDSATMARWALLYGEAMAANRLAAPTDTIIDIAIAYYGSHNEKEAFARAQAAKSRLASADNGADALATALYLQKEKEFLLYRERAHRKQALLIALVVILLTICIIARQRHRLKLKEIQTESLMAEAASLKEGLLRQESEFTALNAKLAASLANRFGLIDELCETYYESQGTKIEKKAIIDKVRLQIEALKADEGIFSEMEKCNEDLLNELRSEIPELKHEDYRLMVYLASGLSNRTIALLIGESINVAYKRKSRLKAKISTSAATHKERFLAVF